MRDKSAARTETAQSPRRRQLLRHRGEVVGLTGLLGSGFEEVPYLLYGARQASSGLLTIRGVPIDLVHLQPAGAIVAGLALIPADRKTDGSVGSLPVDENIALPVLDRYFNGVTLDHRRMRRETGALMGEFDVRPNDPSLPYGRGPEPSASRVGPRSTRPCTTETGFPTGV